MLVAQAYQTCQLLASLKLAQLQDCMNSSTILHKRSEGVAQDLDMPDPDWMSAMGLSTGFLTKSGNADDQVSKLKRYYGGASLPNYVGFVNQEPNEKAVYWGDDSRPVAYTEPDWLSIINEAVSTPFGMPASPAGGMYADRNRYYDAVPQIGVQKRSPSFWRMYDRNQPYTYMRRANDHRTLLSKFLDALKIDIGNFYLLSRSGNVSHFFC